jgi:hypothetical protein
MWHSSTPPGRTKLFACRSVVRIAPCPSTQSDVTGKRTWAGLLVASPFAGSLHYLAEVADYEKTEQASEEPGKYALHVFMLLSICLPALIVSAETIKRQRI